MTAFGNPQTGGCPACAYNVEQFWCTATCSPHQSDFIRANGYENVTNPEDPTGPLKQVLKLSMRMSKSYACSVYAQCAATNKAKLLDTTTEGFFQYQGKTQGIPKGVWYSFDYETTARDPLALHQPLQLCCSYENAVVSPSPAASAQQILDATVQLKSGSSVRYETRSDASGRYGFDNIAAGTYTLVCRKNGFEDWSGNVTVNDGQQIFGQNISLAPITDSDAPAPPKNVKVVGGGG